MQNIVILIICLVSSIIRPTNRFGANHFRLNWDSHIEWPNIKLKPPRFIQWRFRISPKQINIITYLYFLSEMLYWVFVVITIPLCIFLDYYLLMHVITVFASISVGIYLFIGVVRLIVCISISQINGKNNPSLKLHPETNNLYGGSYTSETIYKKVGDIVRIFSENPDDFGRLKDILTKNDILSEVFPKKKEQTLDLSHLTRNKKYFTAEDYKFVLYFFKRYVPFYIDFEDDCLQILFFMDSKNTPMICWDSKHRSISQIEKVMGEDVSLMRLNNEWFMLEFK